MFDTGQRKAVLAMDREGLQALATGLTESDIHSEENFISLNSWSSSL